MKKLLFLFLLFFTINVYANDDLINLSVNGKKVSCSGYECTIEIESANATVTYELGKNVKNATPSSGHKVSFDNEHSMPIEVEYYDSVKANYTLTIKKHIASSVNTLKTLMINDEEILLKEDVYVYSYDAKFNDEVIEVIGTASDDKAVCEKKEYKFDLEKSSLSIIYPVKAENGDIRNYTIILKRKNRPDTSLKTLTLSNIDFLFDSKKLEYEITVPYSVFQTKINAIANNDLAEVIVDNENLDLVVGENIVNIKVKNEDIVDIYVLKIIRLENIDETIANLKSLIIENYKIKFDPNKYNYDLFFQEIPNKLLIEAEAVKEDAVITILDNENLEDGSIVSIKVLLDNGLSKTYKLNIKLEEKIVKEYNKILIIVLIIILLIIMILLLIFQIKDNKKQRVARKNKVEKKEEEIELI